MDDLTISPEFSKAVEKYMPFLMEIRRRLMFVVAVFFIAGIAGFVYYEKIVKLVLSIFNLEGVNIVFTSPFQFMNLAVSSAVFIGVLTIFPLFIIQFLSFIKPALKPREFKVVVGLVPLSIFLFLLGFGVGAIMMRYVVILFYQKSVELDIGNFLDVSRLLSQIIMTAALMGAAFQFPIVMTLLMKLKVVKYKTIASQRMIAYGSSILFAALLPPTDILSLFMLTAPLIFLFELTLFMNKFVFKPAR